MLSLLLITATFKYTCKNLFKHAHVYIQRKLKKKFCTKNKKNKLQLQAKLKLEYIILTNVLYLYS